MLNIIIEKTQMLKKVNNAQCDVIKVYKRKINYYINNKSKMSILKQDQCDKTTYKRHFPHEKTHTYTQTLQ